MKCFQETSPVTPDTIGKDDKSFAAFAVNAIKNTKIELPTAPQNQNGK